MSSFLYRLGRAAVRARVLVVALWVVVLAVAGGAALVFNQGTDDAFAPRSSSPTAADTCRPSNFAMARCCPPLPDTTTKDSL